MPLQSLVVQEASPSFLLERKLTCPRNVALCLLLVSDEGGAGERSAAHAARSAAGRCDDDVARFALMEAKEAEYEERQKQKGPVSALQRLMVRAWTPCAPPRHRVARPALSCTVLYLLQARVLTSAVAARQQAPCNILYLSILLCAPAAVTGGPTSLWKHQEAGNPIGRENQRQLEQSQQPCARGEPPPEAAQNEQPPHPDWLHQPPQAVHHK